MAHTWIQPYNSFEFEQFTQQTLQVRMGSYSHPIPSYEFLSISLSFFLLHLVDPEAIDPGARVCGDNEAAAGHSLDSQVPA